MLALSFIPKNKSNKSNKQINHKDVIYKQINQNNSTKTIVHVLDYNNGFGDYLRGSIFLAHYAKYFNIQFRLNISQHHISKYFNVKRFPIGNIHIIRPNNLPDTSPVHTQDINKSNIIPFLTSFMKSNQRSVYINTCNYYNTKWLTNDIRQYINSFLSIKPRYYDKAKELFNLDIYQVLHIRCKDSEFYTEFTDDILLREIDSLHLPLSTIVLSNNYSLKQKLNKLYGFHYINQPAEHSAHLKSKLESTIIDYIILSKSSRTYCFSYYGHGSGFSEHCSALHNIPYQVKCL
jgi:hypothetical protein